MWSNRLYKWAWSTLFFLLSLPPASSQIEGAPDTLPVNVYALTGDTLTGHLLFDNLYNLQYSITLCDSAGATLAHYAPKELLGFRFEYLGDTFRYVSKPNPLDIGRLFLIEIASGELSLYQLLEIEYSNAAINYIPFYFLWKNRWLSPPIHKSNAYPAMLHYFGNCPQLEIKIKKHELGFDQLRTILMLYSQCEITDKYDFILE